MRFITVVDNLAQCLGIILEGTEDSGHPEGSRANAMHHEVRSLKMQARAIRAKARGEDPAPHQARARAAADRRQTAVKAFLAKDHRDDQKGPYSATWNKEVAQRAGGRASVPLTKPPEKPAKAVSFKDRLPDIKDGAAPSHDPASGDRYLPADAKTKDYSAFRRAALKRLELVKGGQIKRSKRGRLVPGEPTKVLRSGDDDSK